MSATAFIFARGGSKGVKNKNIYPVAGKPLIAHSIASALASRSVGRVVVSTDDSQIAAAAREHGAEVLDRPAAFAGDTTPEIVAWRHAIDSFRELFRGRTRSPSSRCPPRPRCAPRKTSTPPSSASARTRAMCCSASARPTATRT